MRAPWMVTPLALLALLALLAACGDGQTGPAPRASAGASAARAGSSGRAAVTTHGTASGATASGAAAGSAAATASGAAAGSAAATASGASTESATASAAAGDVPSARIFAKEGPAIVDGAEVRVTSGPFATLDGAVTDDLHIIADSGKVHRLDGFFDPLQAKRKAFDAGQAGAAFPGRARVECAPDVRLSLFKSVFFSMATAGYPHIEVSVPPSAAVSVDAYMPERPKDAPAVPPPARSVTLHVLADWKTQLIRRDGSAVTRKWSPGGGATSRAALEEKLTAEFARESTDGAQVVVHVDDGFHCAEVHEIFEMVNRARGGKGAPLEFAAN